MLEFKYLALISGAVNAQSGDGNFDRITDGKYHIYGEFPDIPEIRLKYDFENF